jgi:hypothetical protein
MLDSRVDPRIISDKSERIFNISALASTSVLLIFFYSTSVGYLEHGVAEGKRLRLIATNPNKAQKTDLVMLTMPAPEVEM